MSKESSRCNCHRQNLDAVKTFLLVGDGLICVAVVEGDDPGRRGGRCRCVGQRDVGSGGARIRRW